MLPRPVTFTPGRCHPRSFLDGRTTELDPQLLTLIKQHPAGGALLAEAGVGPVVAAQLLISWSHRGRVRDEAAFASLAGVSPLETNGHDINAPWTIACGDVYQPPVRLWIRRLPSFGSGALRAHAQVPGTAGIQVVDRRHVAGHKECSVSSQGD